MNTNLARMINCQDDDGISVATVRRVKIHLDYGHIHTATG